MKFNFLRKPVAPAPNPEVTALLAEVQDLKNLLTEQNAHTAAVLKQVETQTRLMDGLRNAALHPLREEIFSTMRNRQLSMFDTLKTVREERLSLARFGDGELRLALYPDFDIKFQQNSVALREELLEAMGSQDLPLLITFPEASRDRFWTDFWTNHWHRLKPLVEQQPRLGHTQVTRREFFGTYRQSAVEAWRSVWEGRDALLVAGKGSRFTMVDDLFGSLNSITRFDAPASNAFDDLDSIVESIIAEKPDLVLAALGPAGTLLAYRLARHGIQTLDIGHITAIWQQVFEGAGTPESLPSVR